MFDNQSGDRRESPGAKSQADAARRTDVDAAVDADTDVGALADAGGATSECESDEGDGAFVAEDADPATDGLAVDELVAQIRAETVAMSAAEARRLSHVAKLAVHLESEAVAMLASMPRVPGAPQDYEVIDSAIDSEVEVVLGIGPGPAARLVGLARRLMTDMPRALDALESGRLDMTRLRALVDGTEVLPGHLRPDVVDEMLAVACDAPWAGLSPRAWRARIDRAVVRADPDAARRRRREAYEARLVRSMATIAGMAELIITADAADVAMAEQVLTDLAHGRDATGPDGEYQTIGQRRVDSFVDVFRRVRDGRDLPQVPVRRERELGLVMHADTFFGDGRAADDPGEIRGLGQTTFVDPQTAREQAQALVGMTSTAASSGEAAIGGAGTASSNRDAAATGGAGSGSSNNAATASTPGASAASESTSSAATGNTNGGAVNGGAATCGAVAGSGAVNVMLVNRAGALVRMVRLAKAPLGGWTRALLQAAVTARLDSLPPLRCGGHDPTVAIQEHVRARNPRCTGYDCPRKAARCDLDHDTPYPRGPTDVNNLDPRCRRQHEHKTRGLVRTRLHPDGAVETTMMLTGLVITTRPEPLPGFAPGEGHGPVADAKGSADVAA